MPRTANLNPNLAAWLDTIAYSEGTTAIPNSDDGYEVLVGSTPSHPILFKDYSKPPIYYDAALDSTAAGRYQDLHHWAVAYIIQLELPDFSPESQDRIAIAQIHECDPGLRLVYAGDLERLVGACSSRWASLPGNAYGQHVQRFANLKATYLAAGGTVA